MVRPRTLALLAVALELGLACGQGPAASSGFTSGMHPITLTGSASGEGSPGSLGSSGSSAVEDSTGGSASGMSSNGSTPVDMGVMPDFGSHPIGCQGKIDFLFVISSWYSMKLVQVQLQEAFPAFTALLEDEFADFDYHIMVVDAGHDALLEETCWACYMCIGCMKPGCAEFGGPPDYPCDVPKVECDVKEGAGVTITGNFGASNTRCELFGDHRYIVKGEPALEETFQCIATLGEGPKTPLPMRAMRKAIEPAMLYNGGCNDGFLRKDALLAVVVLNGDQDNLSPGTPQQWYDALVAAKNGDEEAIVTLVLSNDLDLPNPKCPGIPKGPNPLRLFAEAAAHGRFETMCIESYVPVLKEMAATILEQCALLIPQ